MAGRAWRLAFAAWALLAALTAAAEIAVPDLKARVTDLTQTLSAGERAALEQTLAAFEQRKGSQVAVLIVPTTDGEAIEAFAIRVFDKWKLGRKKVDDGVLLIVAKNDRKLRIEVGYGLEGAIPDAIAKRIIEQDIAPNFRKGDFAAGITAGVDRVMRLIDGEKLPEPGAVPTAGGDIASMLVPAFIIILIVNTVLQALAGRFGGAVLTGLLVAVLGTLMASVAAGLVAGALAFVLGLFNGLKFSNSGSGGRWSSSGSSGWSSGSSSGGGFSGGGGSSGGGGASGSW